MAWRSRLVYTPPARLRFFPCSTFYEDTVDRNWGSAYLKPEFFPMLGEKMADQVGRAKHWLTGGATGALRAQGGRILCTLLTPQAGMGVHGWSHRAVCVSGASWPSECGPSRCVSGASLAQPISESLRHLKALVHAHVISAGDDQSDLHVCLLFRYTVRCGHCLQHSVVAGTCVSS